MSKSVIIGVILLLIVSYFLLRDKESKNSVTEKTLQQPIPDQTQPVNKQASFAIFTNGTFRAFTASMYHNLSEDVFIQAKSPNIIYIKKHGITWDDFFKTLPFSLTKDCLTTGTKETFCTNQNGTLKFYLNGVRSDDFLDRQINYDDKALITYGSEGEKQIQKQIDKLNTLNNN